MFVSEEAQKYADDGEPAELPLQDWQKEEVELARRIESNPDPYLALPSQFDVHEWDIMRRFSDGIGDERIRRDFQDAIHGSGAFRCFKRELDRHDLRDDWYAFRDKVLEEIAIEWCESQRVPYEKGGGSPRGGQQRVQ